MTEKEWSFIIEEDKNRVRSLIRQRNDLIFMFVIGFLSGLAVFGLVLGVLYG